MRSNSRKAGESPLIFFMSILISICLVTSILLIWFKTEAVLEYGSVICPNLLKINEYKTWHKENLELDYLDFLAVNYNSFFIRLVSCPYCLSTWMSVLFSIFCGNLFFAPIIFVFGLTLFFIVVKLGK